MRPRNESDFNLWLHFIFEENVDFVNKKGILSNGWPFGSLLFGAEQRRGMAWH